MHRTVFSFNRRESVKSFINGSGKLSLQYILKVCKVKIYFHLLYAANSLLSGLYWLHYDDCTVIMLMTACVVCLARGMWLLMLCTSISGLIICHSCLCCTF